MWENMIMELLKHTIWKYINITVGEPKVRKHDYGIVETYTMEIQKDNCWWT